MLSALICLGSTAQSKIYLDLSKACFYDGKKLDNDIYSFSATEDAKNIIGQIVNAVGLKANFEIIAASVPNALAAMTNKKRLIIYSETFIQRASLATNTNWAAVSILAHEVGHHLNGHSLDEGIKRPSDELEADEFSGFVLAKLGSNLNQALAAIQTVVEENPTTLNNYPPKSARLEAVSVGWKRGKGPDYSAVPPPERVVPTTGGIQLTNKINTTLTILISKELIEPGNFNIKYEELTLGINGTDSFETLSPGKYYLCAVFSRHDVSGCVFSKTVEVLAGKKTNVTISAIRTAFGK